MNADSNDSNTTLADIKTSIAAYRNERGWNDLSARDLAVSIALEAAELLEHFQWTKAIEHELANNRQEIMDEFGDTLNYLLHLAMTLDFDATRAWFNKLERVKAKYPTSIFNPDEGTDFAAYQNIKRTHRAAKIESPQQIRGKSPAGAAVGKANGADKHNLLPKETLQTCTLVFLRRGDEILLAMKKRGFGKGRWNGAGGKVESGESIEQAMIREAQEEIGVTPTTFRKVAANRFHGVDASGKVWGNVGHTFISDEWQGDPIETEEMAPRWFKLSDIPYHEMWEDDALWLPLVLAGKCLHTDFAFDEYDHMQSAEINIVAPDDI